MADFRPHFSKIANVFKTAIFEDFSASKMADFRPHFSKMKTSAQNCIFVPKIGNRLKMAKSGFLDQNGRIWPIFEKNKQFGHFLCWLNGFKIRYLIAQ